MRDEKVGAAVSMTNTNTLERWRPHPLVFIYCGLAIVLLGSACSAIDDRLHDDWGRGLLSALCDSGSSVRNCFNHCDCSPESLSKGYRLRSKSVPATCGVLSEASDVPVKPALWSHHPDGC